MLSGRHSIILVWVVDIVSLKSPHISLLIILAVTLCIECRCIVAVDGFFEWRQEHKIKQPYYIHFKGKPLLFAGVQLPHSCAVTGISSLGISSTDEQTSLPETITAWLSVLQQKRFERGQPREDRQLKI